MKDNEKFIQEMYASSLERTIKRLWITILILIFLLVGSNICWIVYENQFEDVTQTVTQELEGENASNNFVGGDTYGEGKADNNHNN